MKANIDKKPQDPKPGLIPWIGLILIVAVFIILFGIEVAASFSKTGHIWSEIGLVVLVYASIFIWINTTTGR